MKKLLMTYWPGLILFVACLLIGSVIFMDYGVSWDEPIQRDIGLTTGRYIFKNDPTLKTYQFRNMGTGFELPLVCAEKLLNLKDTRHIYFLRHFLTHLFFLIGAFCFYILSFKLFKSRFIACLGFIMFTFQPRIYGHSFFNCKDIPFLAAFSIVMLLCYVAFEKDKRWWYFIFGLSCGYLTSIRAMGIMLLPIAGFFFTADILSNIRDRSHALKITRNFLLYAAGFFVMLYIAWPVLWSDPINSFKDQFLSLAHIPYEGEAVFNGHSYKGYALPWNYMPVWFSITTPELWLLLGIAGIIGIVIDGITAPKQYLLNTSKRNFLLYLACFMGPILAMAIFHGVNVDDWRHLYFIYPSFVILALFVIARLAKGWKKKLIVLLFGAQMIFVATFIIKNHPFEQLYFNNLISHQKEYIRYNYDFDYWCTAYRKGLEYILAHDNRPGIRIHCWIGPLPGNIDILPESSRKRIVITDRLENADYFITNFRNHPEEYNYPNIYYELRLLNSTFFRVYKLQ